MGQTKNVFYETVRDTSYDSIYSSGVRGIWYIWYWSFDMNTESSFWHEMLASTVCFSCSSGREKPINVLKRQDHRQNITIQYTKSHHCLFLFFYTKINLNQYIFTKSASVAFWVYVSNRVYLRILKLVWTKWICYKKPWGHYWPCIANILFLFEGSR